MRGVTYPVRRYHFKATISTHTPHARRDDSRTLQFWHLSPFQLTRLMRGVTVQRLAKKILPLLFQLTRLMRGVTV